MVKEPEIHKWYHKGELHRDKGPAVICPDGRQEWWWKGKRHRDEGPAITDPSMGPQTEEWFCSGKLHRIGGPAIIGWNGCEWWYLYGWKHRADGPAVMLGDGLVLWYVLDKRIHSFVDYQKELNCGDDHIIMLQLKYGEIKRS